MTTKHVYLSCCDECTTVDMSVDEFSGGDKWYSFSFLTSNLQSNFWWRVKHAWYILIGKKVCWAEVIVDEPEKMEHFLNDCLTLVKES